MLTKYEILQKKDYADKKREALKIKMKNDAIEKKTIVESRKTK